jgi:PAS domain S-box-containing protein
MKKISDLKIKNKLIGIILLVTVSTLVIASTGIIILEKRSRLEVLKNGVSIAARLTAEDLMPAIDFNSPAATFGEILANIKQVEAIKNGFVFDVNDQVLAKYPESDSHKYKMNPPPVFKEKTIIIKGTFIHVYEPISSESNQRNGTLYLRASTEKLDKEVARFTYLVISLVLILIVLSILLANKLQGIISKPILDLVKVTKDVSSEGDYTVRVEKESSDEIGMLYDEFNEMMEQILNRNIERDRVEAKLQSAQFFLSSVIESMPSLLITIEDDGKVTQWNQSAAELTGIDTADAKEKNIWELLPDFSQFKGSISTLSGADESLEFYKKSIKINGNAYYFNGSVFALRESDRPKFVIMLSNVTETELKERQLRQSQKMETVGNLAGGLAHDFNNVLGGIIGTISLYKYKVSKNKEITGEEAEKYFNTIEDSANRASDMVQHLLSLTRKQEIAFTPTNLNEAVKRTVRICKNTFDKSIEIETNYFEDRAMVNADPTLVEQALLNLCINASHSMTMMRGEDEKDGGKLNIAVKKVSVDKFFRRTHTEAEESEYWDISVSDTGVGMDQKTLVKIFDPFFTTKKAGTGSGLGLAMVYNIIKQHKGLIEVYSHEGVGTTFHVFLPIMKGDTREIGLKKPEELLRGEGLILVVDDEEVMRQTARSILMECGYDVVAAENGEEAVKAYKEHRHKIKAVLLDMVMPKMSGRETYVELNKINKNVKVLLVSGFKQDHRVEALLKLGVKDFMQKPYTLLTLANRIYHVINDGPSG